MRLICVLLLASLFVGCGGMGAAPVNVPPPNPNAVLTTVIVTPPAAQIPVGSTQQYTAIGYDAASLPITGVAFIFTSGNNALLAVTGHGAAIGVATGMTTVNVSGQYKGTTVTSSAGVTVIPIIVPPPVGVITTITVVPATATITVGASVTLAAFAQDQSGKPVAAIFTWASTDASAITFNGGTVTGVATGTAHIAASAGGVTSLPALITIIPMSPAPSISRLSPPMALVGSAYSVPLTITGTGFTSDSVVAFAGAQLTPTSVTATKIIADIPQGDLAAAQAASVTVSNTDGVSNALTFNVTTQGFVSVSFDDGYQSTYALGLPILDKAGMSYTWYIITHKPLLADSYFATWLEILNESAKPNVEIGNHTQTHAGITQKSGTIKFLTLLGTAPTDLNSPDYNPCAAGQNDEINPCDPIVTTLQLETAGAQSDFNLMGLTPTTFAYPYGDYNQTVEDAVKAAGLAGARTTDFCVDVASGPPACGYVTAGANAYALQAFEINQGPVPTTLAELKYWTAPALPSAPDPSRRWTIITFHQVDEVDVDSVPHTLLQNMVDYFTAQKIITVTVDEGLTIMNLRGN